MWLHPVENSRFGARHHQVDPQIRSDTPFSFTTAQHNDTAMRDMAPDASRCPDDVRMSQRQTSIDMLFMKQGM